MSMARSAVDPTRWGRCLILPLNGTAWQIHLRCKDSPNVVNDELRLIRRWKVAACFLSAEEYHVGSPLNPRP